MTSKNTSKPVGVIGAGSFGVAIANILAQNTEVLLYARDADVIRQMAATKARKGQKLHTNITATGDLSYIANTCEVIFPIVPSSAFRTMMQQLSPYLHPYHILIHGTKGLDISLADQKTKDLTQELTRENVKTMSEVIADESVVIRTGCLAGPNLAKELAAGQPAATVVASRFDEVITAGERLLKNERFLVYGSKNLIGIELAGVLKNIIAIASGVLSGLSYGENAKGLLISRGVVEMIYLGKAMGGEIGAFLGLAGIGDLVTTCNSTLSRNFTVGYRLAKGEPLKAIIASMEEVAEGINTIKITRQMIADKNVRAPITEVLYEVLFEGMPVSKAINMLMRYPFNVDTDFI